MRNRNAVPTNIRERKRRRDDGSFQTTAYGYDGLGRLTTTTLPDGHRIPTETATTPERTVAYGYHPTGDLAQVTDTNLPGWSQAYALDALNRVIEEHTTGTSLGTARLTHAYDRFGNREALALQVQESGSWQERFRYTYTHDTLDRLIEAALISPDPVRLDYFATDELKTLTHPNGVVTGYAYEPNGPLRSIQVSGTSGVIEQLDYTYDATLNVDTLALATEGTHDYGYDGLHRLTQALHPQATGLDPAAYSYDGVGNRTDAAAPADWAYDGNNRIVQSPGLTYTFDDDGNLTARSDGAVFGYNHDNRLVSHTKDATTAAYAYDPFGRRIKKTVNGTITWYLWDGERLLGEYDAAGNEIRRYAYLPGRYAPTEMADANGTYAIHTDHLDTPRRATDTGQQVVWSAAYEVYGQANVDEDPDGDGTAITLNHRFPGQHADAETGLYYNYFRHYDPQAGRYITSDPIGIAGGLNLYAYVLGNPMINIDPLGLVCCTVRQVTDMECVLSANSKFKRCRRFVVYQNVACVFVCAKLPNPLLKTGCEQLCDLGYRADLRNCQNWLQRDLRGCVTEVCD